MAEENPEALRAELRKLTASGDLLDLALQLRAMGVESLLFATPDGRIQHVVTDRQIAHLAQWHTPEDFIPAQTRRMAVAAEAATLVPAAALEHETAARSAKGEGIRSKAR